MAYAGQTLRNPASGERITFRATAAETDGELVAIDLGLPPGGRVPGPLHIHPRQEERFAVTEGTMRFRVGRRRVIAGPGDVVVVAAGVPHDFANGGDTDAVVHVEVRPALQMERLFETAVHLAEQGRTMRGGLPRPLDLARFLSEFENEVQVPVVPRWLQRLALAPLLWLARARTALDNKKISSYSWWMPRRKPGALLPLEREILGVALSMLRSGHATFYGFGLAQTMREHSGSRALTGHGTLYKALGRLEELGLLTSRWDDATAEGRPRRRLYELTGQGARVAEQTGPGKTGQATGLRPRVASEPA